MSALREVSNLPAKSVADGKVKLTNRSVNTYNTHNVVPRLNKNNNSQGVDDNIRRAYHDVHHQEKRQEQQQQSQQAPEEHNHYSQPACSSQSSQELRPLLYEPHDDDPLYCTDLVQDIMLMFFTKEKEAVRKFNEGIASYDSNTGSLHRYYASPHYLQYQPEINETMRMILVDWLIDVHIKYKLRPETMFLTVNLIDRYLSCQNTKFNSSTFVKRSKLQLVGICSLLLASKYEEIWPVEIDKCVHITANSYTREEIIEMERTMCGALCFRFTVPTSFQFATRLLNLLDGDDFLQQYSHLHHQQQQHYSPHNETDCSDDCDNMELTSQKQRLSMLNVNMMRNFNNHSNSSSSIKHMYNATVDSTFTVTSINDKAESNESDEVMKKKKVLAEQFTLLKHVTFFFMEHALLDYKCLQFTPSQIANACVFLALVTLRLKYNVPILSASNINKNNKSQQSAESKRSEQEQTTSKLSSKSSSSSITSSPQAANSMAFHSIDSFSLAPSMATNTNTHLPESESMTPTNVWSDKLRYHSRAEVSDFKVCANIILEFVNYVPTTKYQAVRRKYGMVKNGEVTKLMMPNELPKK